MFSLFIIPKKFPLACFCIFPQFIASWCYNINIGRVEDIFGGEKMSEERIIMNLALDIYSLMILIAVFFSSTKRHVEKSASRRIFDWMLLVVFFMVFADALSNFDGTTKSFYPFFNKAGNFLIFFLGPIVPGLWLLYVANELLLDSSRIRIYKAMIVAHFVINSLLLIGTQFWGWYYHIDAGNFYQRGPLFPLFQAQNLVMILFPVLLLIRKRRELPHRRVSSLISFALLPLAGIIVQALFYGFSVTVNFLVFALLIAYLFIQSETMDTDFLTGIGNRRKFEVSLNSLVMANKPFSAILLDLDNFKQINDRHGHGAGDLALKKTADILRASVREGDTIARYGGDEFCIITGIDNHAALRECVQRIRDNFQKHNENPETEIHLELSIGYLVYEPGKVSASEFLKKLDQRMYRDKFQRKKSVL